MPLPTSHVASLRLPQHHPQSSKESSPNNKITWVRSFMSTRSNMYHHLFNDQNHFYSTLCFKGWTFENCSFSLLIEGLSSVLRVTESPWTLCGFHIKNNFQLRISCRCVEALGKPKLSVTMRISWRDYYELTLTHGKFCNRRKMWSLYIE